MVTVSLSRAIIIATFAVIFFGTVAWFAITRGTWKPLSHDPLFVIISFIGSIAIVIFAGATLYFNSRPLITCSYAQYDNQKNILSFIIENKSNNAGVAKASFVIISTNEEEKRTIPVVSSENKILLKLFPKDKLSIPVQIDIEDVKDHFHLLVLIETSFLCIEQINETVLYWDKEIDHPFVRQNRYNKKYKEIFDEYFRRLYKLSILK